jgi:hypothetical protein
MAAFGAVLFCERGEWTTHPVAHEDDGFDRHQNGRGPEPGTAQSEDPGDEYPNVDTAIATWITVWMMRTTARRLSP